MLQHLRTIEQHVADRSRARDFLLYTSPFILCDRSSASKFVMCRAANHTMHTIRSISLLSLSLSICAWSWCSLVYKTAVHLASRGQKVRSLSVRLSTRSVWFHLYIYVLVYENARRHLFLSFFSLLFFFFFFFAFAAVFFSALQMKTD